MSEIKDETKLDSEFDTTDAPPAVGRTITEESIERLKLAAEIQVKAAEAIGGFAPVLAGQAEVAPNGPAVEMVLQEGMDQEAPIMEPFRQGPCEGEHETDCGAEDCYRRPTPLPVKSPFMIAEGQSDGTLVESLAKAMTGVNKTEALHKKILEMTHEAGLMALGLTKVLAITSDESTVEITDDMRYTETDICREISSGRLHMEDVARQFIKTISYAVKRWERDQGLRVGT